VEVQHNAEVVRVEWGVPIDDLPQRLWLVESPDRHLLNYVVFMPQDTVLVVKEREL
jgi:hypothetical protein